MTQNFIPQVLQGDGIDIEKKLKHPAKAIAEGKGIEASLDLAPSPDSLRSAVEIVFERKAFLEGFHVGGLIPLVYDAWAKRRLKADDADWDAMDDKLTPIYADFLSRPWGVLCALPIHSQVMVLDDNYQDHAVRTKMLVEAVKRERDFLHQLDGRFTNGRMEKPSHPWDVDNMVSHLAARNKLPKPASWATWEAAVEALLEVYS